MRFFFFTIISICFHFIPAKAQNDIRLYEIIDAISAQRLEKDVRTLVGFGTRHTLSDTLSEKRGIGAARRWIKKEFETISKDCGNCLEVFYQKNHFTPEDGEQNCKACLD